MARRADLPLHSDKGRAWDGPAAASRMLDAATDGEGNINSSRASEGFTYMLNGGENRGDYKSPFADVIDGSKKVVWRGVNAALARNSQVQGISDEERSGGETFLRGQQGRFPDSGEGNEERFTYRNTLPFQLDQPVREAGRVLVASGERSRNRDWWTGKAYRLVPAGMRLDNWRKNNLVLWMHNFNVPLAKGKLFMEDGKLWAFDDFEFHRKVIPVAVQGLVDTIGLFDTGVIADLWDEGFYNAVSIHVMFDHADERVVIEEEEEIIFPTSEVIEFSIVTVPGDPEAVREELIDRLVFEGVDKAVAECVACNTGPVYVPDQRLWLPRNDKKVIGTANGGSRNVISVKPEAKMNESEVVETSVAAEGEETRVLADGEEVTLEMVEEVEQEIDVDLSDLVRAVTEDEEAMGLLAIALVNRPGFVEAIREHIIGEPVAGEILEAVPPRIILKFNGSQPGRRTAPQKPAVREIKEATPVQLPGGEAKRRKPSVLDLYRQ